MQFINRLLAATAALASLAHAVNSVTFVSQDSTGRTVYFTGNPGKAAIPPVKVSGNGQVRVEFPYNWIGNFFSISDGKPVIPGMLGEVAFNEWGDLTYFDVSAIVDPNDWEGVKTMYPASGREPTSGCERFPCNNAYYLPDDLQTKAVQESDLICTLGNKGAGGGGFGPQSDDTSDDSSDVSGFNNGISDVQSRDKLESVYYYDSDWDNDSDSDSDDEDAAPVVPVNIAHGAWYRRSAADEPSQNWPRDYVVGKKASAAARSA